MVDETQRRPETGPTFADFNAYTPAVGKRPGELTTFDEEQTALAPAAAKVVGEVPLRGTILAVTVIALAGSQPKAGPVPKEGRL